MLHPFNLLLELNLPLKDQSIEASVLIGSSLANSVVEEQFFALNRLAALARDLHKIPGAGLASLFEQLHCQTRDFTFFSDVRAEIISLLFKGSFASYIDNEIVSIKLLNVSDALVLLKKLTKVILDAAKLLHDLIPEVLLSLIIGLLELNNHQLGDGLKLIDWAGLAFGDFG